MSTNPYLDDTISLIEGETYYVAFININSGESTRTSVTVSLSGCPDIIIPDIFTPNGDGINDVFIIPDLNILYPNYNIEIYNRYGNIVYKGNSNTEPFDGTSNDKYFINNDILPTGVYFYIINFNKDDKQAVQGLSLIHI